ncbi:MAG: VOC family protein [Chloroflexi bacterium]|nr:VOC family protein [Chloroflexota bacterium]
MDYRIEAITLPVADVDRAKAFYEQAGWHLDVDTEPAPGLRVVQFTPPGSNCSISFGTGMPQAEPGSYRSTYLVVADVVSAHAALKERGIPVDDIFHFGAAGMTPGPDPNHADYGSYATFADPDGNTWLLQEVPSRGRAE